MEIAASLGVDKSENVTIGDEFRWSFGVVLWLVTVWIEPPFVVGIFVMITCDLLLTGTFRESLDVGVQKATSVTHILDRSTGAVSNLKRAILADFGTFEICLEEGAHLSITWTAVL